MPDMKRFLKPNTFFGKILLLGLIVFATTMILVFTVSMIMDGVPLFMILIPIMPFLLGAGFCVFLLRKNGETFTKWWNGLTEQQRGEIEADYSSAYQADPALIVGKRYAFIRESGRAVAYEDIEEVYFRRTQKWRWNMFVVLRDGRKVVAALPAMSNKDVVWDELLYRSGKGGETW